jgi:hypothetical protein
MSTAPPELLTKRAWPPELPNWISVVPPSLFTIVAFAAVEVEEPPSKELLNTIRPALLVILAFPAELPPMKTACPPFIFVMFESAAVLALSNVVNGVDCPPMPLFVIVAKPALLEPVKEVNPRPALEALFEMVEFEAVLESPKLTPAEFALGTTLTPVNEMI